LTFFESLLVLLAVAIALLQISRRLSIPYPTMLAAAGVILALVPGAPKISLDPHMALALFISPAIVDAAFDFPIAAIRRYWRPLFALAVVAVLLTAAAVAWLGMAMAGLPLFAALALGAIVAPPDAAAATAVLGSVNMPRRTVTIIKGESLLNDATALLLFSMAVALQNQGAITGGFALQLGLAAPGGILLGIGVARLFLYVRPLLNGTRGANLSEFVGCFSLWIIAEHLKLSAVLCTVAFAMTLATKINLTNPPRMRIHSFAVWDAAVFSLNVFAFLLMGFQARAIIGAMTPDRLEAAGWFAGAVVACLIGVRLLWLLIYNRLAARFQWLRGDLAPASLSQGVLVGWCGMRGLVTLATAFSLPATFPQRDLIVLTAFAVVLATLIIQGLSLPALIHLLKLDGDNGLDRELADIRADLANVALETLGETKGRSADFWRYEFEIARTAAMTTAGKDRLEEKRRLGLQALHRQRDRLEVLRNAEQAGSDAYLIVQEELDFAEVSLTSEQDRRIEES
jgi:CPA1 family monovalent cation:H+ antiporter